MRFLKKQISVHKILLCVSVLFNLLLLAVVVVAEKHSHIFSLELERRSIINLDDKMHPDYWARVGWTNTVRKLHTDFDICFFGNSITRGSDFQQVFPEKKIINIGYSGDNILGMVRRVPMIKAANPKKIFIMAGTNDLFRINISAFEYRYNKLINLISDSIPNAEIYLQSILPMNQEMKSGAPSDEKIQEANRSIAKIAGERGLTYIDIYSLYVEDKKLPANITKDGIHLRPQYYDRWAEEIERYVME